MKTNLNQNQYQMNDHERESLWQDIRHETTAPAGPSTQRGSFRPSLAVTAVLATVTLMVAWHQGSRQVGQQERESYGTPVVILESDTAPRATSKAAAAPALSVLSGRIKDKESGEALAYANVMIRGTTFGVITDSLGNFRFENLPAGQEIQLVAKMLSYEPFNVALATPDKGDLKQEIEMRPIIVETLQAFDVEGAEYMVEVRSSVSEHRVSSETFNKYAIDSVEEALSKKAGVVMRSGEIHTRGGRSGDVSMSVTGRPAPPKSREVGPPLSPSGASNGATEGAIMGSVTGGTTAPNGEQVELMYFENFGVNPFVATEDDALSTFAVDVDNASWTLARNYLARGIMPPKDAIRVEEFVNAFDAGWPTHTDQPFRIHTESAASRFGDGYQLLRVGIVGQDLDDAGRKPANLVFVVDISGSMDREGRLNMVKQALHILLDELGEGDKVGLVVYGNRGQVRLPLTDISQRKKIAAAINGLRSGGSTNAAEGLELGYAMARENYDAGIINRLVLCSDGVANTGANTEAGGILNLVRRASDEGITLSTIGFGMGNYNDVLMEKLANQGDGNYYYVDQLAEAERVFRENLTSLLQTIAREVKVQVEFDQNFVQRWRLLGYENRDVADEDFRNDKVDAGEVGVGHQVTALYELKLTEQADQLRAAKSGERLPTPAFLAGTIRVRYEASAHDLAHAGEVTEIEQGILVSQIEGNYAAGTPWMKVQTVVAEFAEILRGSYWAKGNSLANLVPVSDALAKELPGDEQVQELAQMIRQAADLAAKDD